MTRGRPTLGADLVDRLDGPRGQRRVLRILLATLAGQVSIAEGCAELGIGRSRLHQLRWRVLEAGFAALGPRPRGRRRQVAVATPEVSRLQARIRELEVALQTTALRSEIALTMPQLLDRAARKKKERSPRRAPAARRRRGPGMPGARR
jgi:helix-turn-helix protein